MCCVTGQGDFPVRIYNIFALKMTPDQHLMDILKKCNDGNVFWIVNICITHACLKLFALRRTADIQHWGWG